MSGPAPAAEPGARAGRRFAPGASVAVLALALLVFVAVVIASLRRSPTLGGLLTGVFAGLFGALLLAAAGAFAIVWLVTPRAEPPPQDLEKADALERILAPTLAQLEAARVEIVRRVNARLVTRVPLGIAAGVVFWTGTQFSDDRGTIYNLLQFGGLGAVAGWYWASRKLSEQYRALYKQRVLPQLAAQFGALSYRPAVAPDMGALRTHHIFREFDRVVAEDEIFGTYRTLPLNIVELELTYGSGKHRRVEFDGLLTQVELPRRLAGVTAVIADNGALGDLQDRFGAKGCERVRLEDPVFEKAYEVYATDQVEARALLTPAFMERFLTLGERTGYRRPLALVEGARLTIALPKDRGKDLFEPPSYRQAAASREALLNLYGDIQAVLSAADAVIDLDQFARRLLAEPPAA